MTGLSDVYAPTTAADAARAFGDGSGVTVLGGGTIVMPDVKLGRLRPEHVLFLGRAELAGITRTGSTYRIGAMTPVSALVGATPEPLSSFAAHVGDYEIRRQATIGGNVCASPGATTPRGDLQAPLLALAARVRSVGAGGERTELVDDFLAQPDERRLVLEIELDEPRRAATAGLRRPHTHAFSTLAVAAAETDDGVRLAVVGGGRSVARATSVEQALAGGASPEEAAERVREDLEPVDDALATAWYRQELLPRLIAQALTDLTGGDAAR